MDEPRLYLYKLTTDNNGAPCIHDGLLSLAICKPRIRSTAETGDIIIGFAANSLHRDNRLIYVARVTEVVPDGEYYREPGFSLRPDCIYEIGEGGYRVRDGAAYHASGEQLAVDLGPARRPTVLLSNDFRYFGSDYPDDLSEYPEIERAVQRLGRGHRVNHPPALREELVRLSTSLRTHVL